MGDLRLDKLAIVQTFDGEAGFQRSSVLWTAPATNLQGKRVARASRGRTLYAIRIIQHHDAVFDISLK